ncbi:MAG TPA: 6-phosphofructokinase [Candidatus Krumholzibacteria bacterium]|nr:6-phosphofructokinase [Candidatus Krumholzibacteria bacterium]
MKKIAVMTSGGDAAGMNAAVRAVVRTAVYHGIEVVGVQRGFVGLCEGSFEAMDANSVGGILHHGGTILRTFRCPDFQQPTTREAARDRFLDLGVEGLVVIGGDGSFRGAHCIDTEWDIPTVGVPATIDNDIDGTDYSIGYDTALNIAVDAVDKIRDTATSHGRIFCIEVMGRNSGMLAIATGLCSGAEEVIVPEMPFNINEMCQRIEGGYDRGKKHAIIIIAEGAARADEIATGLKLILSRDVRVVVLGHIQRGGEPSAFDRILASRLGTAAVQKLLSGKRDVMVGLVGGEIFTTPLVKESRGVQLVMQEYLDLQDKLC